MSRHYRRANPDGKNVHSVSFQDYKLNNDFIILGAQQTSKSFVFILGVEVEYTIHS